MSKTFEVGTKQSKMVKKTKFKRLKVRENIALLAIFVALSFILYGISIPYGYVLDDKIVIVDNAYTKEGLGGIWKILSTESFQGYFGEQKDLVQGGRYRPLSIVTFAVEYALFGLNPHLSHLFNILLYALCALMAFFCLRRMLLENIEWTRIYMSISFVTALIYLAHPLHTEAVANIKGRDEIMAFLFGMSAFFFAFKFVDRRKRKFLVLSLGMYLLGLLSKENDITFLGIIPFGLILFRRKHFKSTLLVASMLFLTSVVYLFARYQVIGYLFYSVPTNDLMNDPFINMSFAQKYATILYTLGVYFKLSFFPHPLTHDYYPYHIPICDLTNPVTIISLVIYTTMVGLLIYFWKKKPLVSFAIGFYLMALSIASNILISVGTFMNERFAFAASLGMCLLLAIIMFGIQAKLGKKYKVVIPVVLGIIFMAFSIKTIARVPAWKDALSLNSAAVKVSKNSARANSFMSTALFNKYKVSTDRNEQLQLLNEAKPYMERAIEIYPLYQNAHIMKAGIAAELYKIDNDLGKLLHTFKEVMNYRPDINYLTEYLEYLNPRINASTMIDFYLDAAYDGLVRQNRNVTWGIHFLLMANKIDPDDQRVRAALAEGYRKIGKENYARHFDN